MSAIGIVVGASPKAEPQAHAVAIGVDAGSLVSYVRHVVATKEYRTEAEPAALPPPAAVVPVPGPVDTLADAIESYSCFDISEEARRSAGGVLAGVHDDSVQRVLREVLPLYPGFGFFALEYSLGSSATPVDIDEVAEAGPRHEHWSVVRSSVCVIAGGVIWHVVDRRNRELASWAVAHPEDVAAELDALRRSEARRIAEALLS